MTEGFQIPGWFLREFHEERVVVTARKIEHHGKDLLIAFIILLTELLQHLHQTWTRPLRQMHDRHTREPPPKIICIRRDLGGKADCRDCWEENSSLTVMEATQNDSTMTRTLFASLVFYRQILWRASSSTERLPLLERFQITGCETSLTKKKHPFFVTFPNSDTSYTPRFRLPWRIRNHYAIPPPNESPYQRSKRESGFRDNLLPDVNASG